MRQHYLSMLKDSEEGIKKVLQTQQMDPNKESYGGFLSYRDETYHPQSPIGALLHIVTLYCNNGSKYYRSKLLYERAMIAIRFINKIQRPDGTFDGLGTNFYSGPDVAFVMHVLVPTYRILEMYGKDSKACQIMRDEVYKIIKKCSYGINFGGFHTPNHRWMNASALFMGYNITGVEQFRQMAERYLQEGIDCNEDGEYTERSAGVYNAVNDIALIYIAEETGKWELLEHVKRNLDMMFYYYDLDGSVFTQNSTRQDKGYNKVFPSNYYHIYLYMGEKFNNKEYITMANEIVNKCARQNGMIPNYLYFYMCRPDLIDFESESVALPKKMKKFFESSGIVREKTEDTILTLIKGESKFLYYQVGELNLYMRICSSFFAVAQFKPQLIQQTEKGYKLEFSTAADYRMPLEKPPLSSEWELIDHSKRKHVRALELKIIVEVEQNDRELIITTQTIGCDRVPFKIDIGFTEECVVTTPTLSIKGLSGEGLVIKQGEIEVRKDYDAIRIKGAFGEHFYAKDMRGSEQQNPNDFMIYFTGYTPIKNRLILEKI